MQVAEETFESNLFAFDGTDVLLHSPVFVQPVHCTYVQVGLSPL